MKNYDLAFSCGYSCGVTQALRAANLQFASFPFDWTASQGFLACARMVADDFAHWMDRADLELVDVRRGGINKHVYRSRRNGFGFVHDFSSYQTFDEAYPVVAEKYARRIARLQGDLARARAVLAVCVEWPIRPRAPDAELAEAKRVFEAKYPNAAFDLLYFYGEDGCREPRVVRSADGVTVVANDYRTFEDGVLGHEMDNRALTAYLRAQATVTDSRTPEEKAKYAADWTKQDRSRWHGRNGFEDFVNRTAFRHYRRLEKFLVRKRLVPPERPLWCLAPGHDFKG